MRKILSILLSAAMLVTLMGLPVAAEGTPSGEGTETSQNKAIIGTIGHVGDPNAVEPSEYSITPIPTGDTWKSPVRVTVTAKTQRISYNRDELEEGTIEIDHSKTFTLYRSQTLQITCQEDGQTREDEYYYSIDYEKPLAIPLGAMLEVGSGSSSYNSGIVSIDSNGYAHANADGTTVLWMYGEARTVTVTRSQVGYSLSPTYGQNHIYINIKADPGYKVYYSYGDGSGTIQNGQSLSLDLRYSQYLRINPYPVGSLTEDKQHYELSEYTYLYQIQTAMQAKGVNRWFSKLNKVADTLAKRKFKYDGVKVKKWSKAKKVKKKSKRRCDCAGFVSYALQTVSSVKKKGYKGTFYIKNGKKFKLTGGSKLGKGVVKYKIHGNHTAKELVQNGTFQEGDIGLFCLKGNVGHVSVLYGRDLNGGIIWYNGGKDATTRHNRKGGRYLKGHFIEQASYLDRAKVRYIIRIKQF